MKLSEFAAYDGIGLAELIRRRDVTPKEIGQCVLAGIEKCNPRLNAVIETYADAVEGLGEHPTFAPFFGLPTLTKDFPIEAQRPAEFGSCFAKGYKAAYDLGFWSRLKGAGLVNIGRTTTSEFGIAAATESSLYGSTRNPWDSNRGVAGSSGGSAAAVAAGIVPFAQGADGGGSIRTPASFCGVVGLKPSRGRVSGAPESNSPLLGLAISFMLTRTIRDTAALLDIASGAFPGDGYEIVRPPASYLSAIEAAPRSLRVALCTTSWSGYPVEAGVKSAVLSVGRQLEQHGHMITETSPSFDYESYLAAQKIIWAAFTAQSLDELAAQVRRPIDRGVVQETTHTMYLHGKSLPATALIEALGIYDQVTRRLGEFLTAYDVLVTPTCPTTPELIGTYDPDRPGCSIDRIFEDLAPKETFSALFNCTGLPAISLPLGWTQTGLPIGVQMVAAFGLDHLLLSLAAELERDYQWNLRRPPVHVANAV